MAVRLASLAAVLSWGACASPQKAVTDAAELVGRGATDGGAAYNNNGSFPVGNAAAAGAAALAATLVKEKPGFDGPHIEGVCLLQEGAQEIPCASLTVVLVDGFGNEASRMRTTPTGQFFFVVDHQSHYGIRALSNRFVSTVEPVEALTAGTRATLRLRAI